MPHATYSHTCYVPSTHQPTHPPSHATRLTCMYADWVTGITFNVSPVSCSIKDQNKNTLHPPDLISTSSQLTQQFSQHLTIIYVLCEVTYNNTSIFQWVVDPAEKGLKIRRPSKIISLLHCLGEEGELVGRREREEKEQSWLPPSAPWQQAVVGLVAGAQFFPRQRLGAWPVQVACMRMSSCVVIFLSNFGDNGLHKASSSKS